MRKKKRRAPKTQIYEMGKKERKKKHNIHTVNTKHTYSPEAAKEDRKKAFQNNNKNKDQNTNTPLFHIFLALLTHSFTNFLTD